MDVKFLTKHQQQKDDKTKKSLSLSFTAVLNEKETSHSDMPIQ
jgi:hypothetical protein